MSDERQGERLWPALERLPAGSGVVLRHYGLPKAKRRELIGRVRRIARRRRLTLIVAGPPRLAVACRADGFHERSPRIGPGHLLRTMPVHDRTELVTAARARADLVFVSPVFPTRSHPGARTLGPRGFAVLARQAKQPALALGGMSARRARRLAETGLYGWAAIGALTPEIDDPND